MDKIIHLRYAMRGTGTTAVDGATRALIRGNLELKRSRSGGLEITAGAYKTGAAPQVILETENFADVIAALKNQMDAQTLVLGYVSSAGNRMLTVKFATATDVGDSELPPAEGSGSVPRYQITFDVHMGTGVTSLATALVDAADA